MLPPVKPVSGKVKTFGEGVKLLWIQKDNFKHEYMRNFRKMNPKTGFLDKQSFRKLSRLVALLFFLMFAHQYSAQSIDSDGDGIADSIDLDDDNDGIPDILENGACGVPPPTIIPGNGFLTHYLFNETFGTMSTVTGTRSVNMTTLGTGANTTYNYYEAVLGTTPSSSNDGSGPPNSLQDGRYTIFNNIRNTAQWSSSLWQNIGDHTNGGTTPTAGRMLIVNASAAPGEFYRKTLTNVIQGAPISASLWVMNLDLNTSSNNNRRLPDITVRFIQGGVTIYSYNTGEIPRYSAGDVNAWRFFKNPSVFFPSSGQPIDVVFVNNSPGGEGNDLAIDDIIIYQSLCDYDNDGIPNYLDLDSDNDGCPDALEGAGNFNPSATASGTLSTQTPNINFGTAVDANGVPTVVAAGGQGLGQSLDPSKNDCLDYDGDGYPDWQDLDDDNDGIPDKDECIGFVSSNTNGVWKGRTASNITIAANPATTSSGINQFLTTDPEVNFSANTNGGTPRFTTASSSTSYTITFSNAVPANEIGLMIHDVNVRSALSPNAAFKIEVNFGSGFVNPSGAFVKTLAGRQEGVGYDVNMGVPTFQDLPNPADTNGGEDLLLKGVGTRLIKAVRISGSNVSTAVPGSDTVSYSFFAFVNCDLDGDGLPNHLDLDSDGDGCSDVLEGGATFTTAHLQDSALPGGNSGPGYTGTAAPVIQNLGNTVGSTATTFGIPTLAGTGQGIGDSQNAGINLQCAPFCFKPAVIDAGNTYPAKHGITALGRAGADNGNWPMVRQSAWTVLESKEKGFVVNRVATTAALVNITNPVAGMMVYDEQADCLKIYSLKSGDPAMAWHCFLTPACPD